jgi:ABC-2 type transport system permease protein
MRPVTSYHAKTVHPPASRSGAHQVGGRHDPFGAGFGAVAAIAEAWLRGRSAIVALCILAVTSYLLVLFVPLLDWPSWIERLSVSGAFGHPYLELPPLGGLVAWASLAPSAPLRGL